MGQCMPGTPRGFEKFSLICFVASKRSVDAFFSSLHSFGEIGRSMARYLSIGFCLQTGSDSDRMVLTLHDGGYSGGLVGIPCLQERNVCQAPFGGSRIFHKYGLLPARILWMHFSVLCILMVKLVAPWLGIFQYDFACKQVRTVI